MVRRPPATNTQSLYADRCINMHKRATSDIRHERVDPLRRRRHSPLRCPFRNPGYVTAWTVTGAITQVTVHDHDAATVRPLETRAPPRPGPQARAGGRRG